MSSHDWEEAFVEFMKSLKAVADTKPIVWGDIQLVLNESCNETVNCRIQSAVYYHQLTNHDSTCQIKFNPSNDEIEKTDRLEKERAEILDAMSHIPIIELEHPESDPEECFQNGIPYSGFDQVSSHGLHGQPVTVNVDQMDVTDQPCPSRRFPQHPLQINESLWQICISAAHPRESSIVSTPKPSQSEASCNDNNNQG